MIKEDGGNPRKQRGEAKSTCKSLRPLGWKPPEVWGAYGEREGRNSDSKPDGRETKPSPTNTVDRPIFIDNTSWPTLGEFPVPTGRTVSNERSIGAQNVATSGVKRQEKNRGRFDIELQVPRSIGDSWEGNVRVGCRRKQGEGWARREQQGRHPF